MENNGCADAIARELFAALSHKDRERMSMILHPDVHFRQHPLPALKGHQQVMRLFSFLTLKWIQWHMVEQHAWHSSPQSVSIERTEKIQVGPMPLVLRGVIIIRVHQGKIIAIDDYIDLLSCLLAPLAALIRGLKKITVPLTRLYSNITI